MSDARATCTKLSGLAPRCGSCSEKGETAYKVPSSLLIWLQLHTALAAG